MFPLAYHHHSRQGSGSSNAWQGPPEPVEWRCRDCGATFDGSVWTDACPGCGGEIEDPTQPSKPKLKKETPKPLTFMEKVRKFIGG